MKKQELFSFCLIAVSAMFVVGCATKQELSSQKSEQDVTDLTVTDDVRQAQNDVDLVPSTAEQSNGMSEPKVEQPKPVHPQTVPYIVTAGDSLSALATRFDTRLADILALNSSLRANPNSLRVGQKVMFPAGTDVTKKARPRSDKKPVVQSSKTSGNTVTYTVKAGDVLGGIAVRHGVTVAAIKNANNLQKDTIWVGQKLMIPSATKKPATTVKSDTKAPATGEVKTSSAKDEPKVAESNPEDSGVVSSVQSNELGVPPPPAVEDGVLPPPVDALPAAQPVSKSYVVQPGEDLVSVALKWGISLPALRAANGIDEANGNTVAVGTTLQIPVVAQ